MWLLLCFIPFLIGCVPSNYYHLRGTIPGHSSPESFRVVPYYVDSLSKKIAVHTIKYNGDSYDLSWLDGFLVKEIDFFSNGKIYQRMKISYIIKGNQIKEIQALLKNDGDQDSILIPVNTPSKFFVDLGNLEK